jgi:hypothetical protein
VQKPVEEYSMPEIKFVSEQIGVSPLAADVRMSGRRRKR